MPKPAKILHHVKRLAASLSVSTATESDIDLLIKTLTSTYREYALEPVQQLRQAVSQALLSVTCNSNLQEGKVMSLNQMVSSQYRGTASKRQRPAESEENVSDSDTAIAADDFFQFSSSGSRSTPQKNNVDSYGDNSRSIENEASNGVQNTSNSNADSSAKISSTSASSSSKKKGRARSSSSKGENSSSNSQIASGNNVEDDIVDAIMNKGRSRVSEFLISRPNARLSDMAGIDSITLQVKELVFYPVLYPNLYNYLGVQPPCGLLLHGPSGCGKTSLAYAIAGELGLPFFKASGPELIGGTSGESEERIRDIFLAASAAAPSVLFIDALDVIAGKKDSSQRGMDRRIVAQLFDSIDGIIRLGEDNLRSLDQTANNGLPSPPSVGDMDSIRETDGASSNKGKSSLKKSLVVLIAATNKADSLDAGVRGRFSREISLPVPDAPSRTKILTLMTAKMKLAGDVDLTELGRVTPGFVGADLKALAREAGMLAVSRIVDLSPVTQIESTNSYGVSVRKKDFDLDVLHAQSSRGQIVGDASAQAPCEGEGSALLVSQTDSAVSVSEPVPVSREDTAPAGHAGDCQQTSTQSATDSSPMAVDISTNALDVTAAHPGHAEAGHNSPLTSKDVNADVAVTAVEMRDFTAAAKSVQPTAKREGFAVVPDVTWGDVGALAEVREELLHNVLEPIAHPERFRALGLEVPAGVLFFGPPGCGKTLLAKALANQSGANFISVKGPELLNMYVGESESRVRQVFSRARASAPCVIFFDELDALCPRRGSGAEGGSGVSERVVNQLLTELDGLEARKDVYIIAATNRLELIDEAMLRPGRLGKLLYVPLPDAADRIAILTALVRKVSIDWKNVDIAAIGGDPRTEGFSGADMAALVREAGLSVVRELMSKSKGSSSGSLAGVSVTRPGDDGSTPSSSGSAGVSEVADPGTEGGSEATGSDATEAVCISARHFQSALGRVRPSVALHDRQRYERVQKNIKDGMGAIQALSSAAMKPYN